MSYPWNTGDPTNPFDPAPGVTDLVRRARAAFDTRRKWRFGPQPQMPNVTAPMPLDGVVTPTQRPGILMPGPDAPDPDLWNAGFDTDPRQPNRPPLGTLPIGNVPFPSSGRAEAFNAQYGEEPQFTPTEAAMPTGAAIDTPGGGLATILSRLSQRVPRFGMPARPAPVPMPTRDLRAEGKKAAIGSAIAALVGGLIGKGNPQAALAGFTGYGQGSLAAGDRAYNEKVRQAADQQRLQDADYANQVLNVQNANQAVEDENAAADVSDKRALGLYNTLTERADKDAAEAKSDSRYQDELAYRYATMNAQQHQQLLSQQQAFLQHVSSAPDADGARAILEAADKSQMLKALGLDKAFPRKADGTLDLDKISMGKPETFKLNVQQQIARMILSSSQIAMGMSTTPEGRAEIAKTIKWAQDQLAPGANLPAPIANDGKAALSAKEAADVKLRQRQAEFDEWWKKQKISIDEERLGVEKQRAQLAAAKGASAGSQKPMRPEQYDKAIMDALAARNKVRNSAPKARTVPRLDPVTGQIVPGQFDVIKPTEEQMNTWRATAAPLVNSYTSYIEELRQRKQATTGVAPATPQTGTFYTKPGQPTSGGGKKFTPPPMPPKGVNPGERRLGLDEIPDDLIPQAPASGFPPGRDAKGRFAKAKATGGLVVDGQPYVIREVG